MIDCPQHGPDCRWYRGSEDQGADLGYGDGFSNARAFAAEHDPIARDQLPVAEFRGDLFALGWFNGLVSAWCVVCDHEAMAADETLYFGQRNRCLAGHEHSKATWESIAA